MHCRQRWTVSSRRGTRQVHFNHRSERHLAAAARAAAAARPAVLITDARNALALAPDRGAPARERELVDLALAALRKDGAPWPGVQTECIRKDYTGGNCGTRDFA